MPEHILYEVNDGVGAITLRDKRIRVISARDLNKKRETDLYEKAP